MNYLVEGISWGLLLTILIGPIFFALLQAGIEYGFRAGFAVGLGIWLSDILYISLMYFGYKHVEQVTALEGFEHWMGLGGGIILAVFGVGTFFTPPPKIQFEGQLEVSVAKPYWSLFTKGFLVNTINPFTLFFWLGIMSTTVFKKSYSPENSFIFFAGIIGTIMLTDSLKVYLAKKIRRILKQKHLQIFRWVTGVILVAFGIVLVIRTW